MLPLINDAYIDPGQEVILDKVLMPFTYDLPNHVIYVS